MPYLELDDGTVVAETVAICEMMEEAVPAPPLFGSTLKDRAVTRMWQRRVEQMIVLNQFSAFRFGAALKLFEGRMTCIPEGAAKFEAIAGKFADN